MPSSGAYTEFSPPSFASGDDLDAFYAGLGIFPSTPPPGSGHPAGGGGGGTTVHNTFNITGVSPTEVMDAIGQDVALNGPLPVHWQAV